MPVDPSRRRAARGLARANAAAARLLPLIVACALLIENMDSTVISTSLPAIARATWHRADRAPQLALTAYLLSLAVFIPVSGWVADRFGARTFASAIFVFLLGSVCVRASGSLATLVAARTLPGHGRRDDGAGRRW